MAMRRCAGGSAVTSVPPMKIRPLDTCSRPAIRRSVVDLPQPDGPSSTSSEAAAASKLTLSTARGALPPQALLTFSNRDLRHRLRPANVVTMPINHCIVKPVLRSRPEETRVASYVLAIDQGTTSTRASLFRADTSVAAFAQQEFPQHFPADGQVEHEPEDLWRTTVECCRGAMRNAGATASDIVAIGITNQRETTLLWDRASGRAVHRAIVWQDRRTADALRAAQGRGP